MTNIPVSFAISLSGSNDIQLTDSAVSNKTHYTVPSSKEITISPIPLPPNNTDLPTSDITYNYQVDVHEGQGFKVVKGGYLHPNETFTFTFGPNSTYMIRMLSKVVSSGATFDSYAYITVGGNEKTSDKPFLTHGKIAVIIIVIILICALIIGGVLVFLFIRHRKKKPKFDTFSSISSSMPSFASSAMAKLNASSYGSKLNTFISKNAPMLMSKFKPM